MAVGKRSAELRVPNVVPMYDRRIEPVHPVPIGTRDGIIDDATVIPSVQRKGLGDVGVVPRPIIDASLEIELQSLHHIDNRLEIRADTPRIEVRRSRFLGLGDRVPPATLCKEMLTAPRVDGMIGHPKNRFVHHACRADASDIRAVLILQGELGLHADPLGNVIVEIQPEIVALVAVIPIANHPLLVRIGPRQVVRRIRASPGHRERLLVFKAVFENRAPPVGRREEEHPPQAGVEGMRDGIGVTRFHPCQQIGGIHRRRAAVDVRLVIHDRHLVVIGRVHHPCQMGRRDVRAVRHCRRPALSFPRGHEKHAVRSASAINGRGGVFQDVDRLDVRRVQQIKVARDAIDQHQRRIATVGSEQPGRVSRN